MERGKGVGAEGLGGTNLCFVLSGIPITLL